MKYELFGMTISISKQESQDMPIDLVEALNTIRIYGEEIAPTTKQIKATKKATKTRQNNAKAKIVKVIDDLSKRTTPITPYSVKQECDCSINTIYKYQDLIDEANILVEQNIIDHKNSEIVRLNEVKEVLFSSIDKVERSEKELTLKNVYFESKCHLYDFQKFEDEIHEIIEKKLKN